MSTIHIKPSHRGLLHKSLGIAANKMIPTSLIRSKLAGSPGKKLKKELVFAENARRWNHK